MESSTQMDIEIEDGNVKYPDLIKRYKSYFIDILFVIIMMMILSEFLSYIPSVPDWVRVVLFLSLWLVYEPLSTATWGCTLGNYLMKIRVREFNDIEKRINIFQAYLRFITKYALGFISCFTVHSNRERRAIHDMVANSVVIEYNG